MGTNTYLQQYAISKYVMGRAVKTKTTSEVTGQLEDIYLDLGLPDIIQHNQSREFAYKVILSVVVILSALQHKYLWYLLIFIDISCVSPQAWCPES